MKCSRCRNRPPVAGRKTCLQCRLSVKTSRLRNIQHYKKMERDYMLRYKYGISAADWDILFDAQGRCCGNPQCKTTKPGGRGWATDHDHRTGQLRAILCQGCNRALGGIGDSVNKLQGLIDLLISSPIEIL